ncbi:MAG: hypothetical protein ACREL1_04625 [bacterium]
MGWAAQRFLHWGNWALITGVLSGIVAGYYGLFLELKSIQNQNPKPPIV